VPKIDNRAVCITTRDSYELPALVSAHFSKDLEYFSVFVFPDIDAPFQEEIEEYEDKFVAKIIGRDAKVLINNALAKLKPRYYILAGLNTHEKTYFDFLPKNRVVIIDSEQDVMEQLGTFRKKLRGEFKCRREDVLKALFRAKRDRLWLRLDDSAPVLTTTKTASVGIVVLEELKKATDIVAVNFAASLNAELEVVEPFNEEKGDIIPLQNHLHKWKKEGSSSALEKIKRRVNRRISHIDFSAYHYASFFTGGLPYGLVVNKIPVSYVNPNLRSDLFVFNGIHSEYSPPTESAVVFSPEEFNDEETPYVIAKLQQRGFYVKGITGPAATVVNFGNYAEHYPYDLLHICSHGGETDGYYVIEKFSDRQEKGHTLEYEEVVGFAPVSGKDLIAVHRKAFFKRFDGFQWMSRELKAQQIPNYVFEDMRKALFAKEKANETQRIRANYPIKTSCHVKCYDSIHQGMFSGGIALYNHPIVFNNTCVSWYDISHFFINCGARGYIGTLWPVKNAHAKSAATLFYMHISASPIAALCRLMNNSLENTVDENVYLYWGLPFTHGSMPSSGNSKQVVFRELLRGVRQFAIHFGQIQKSDVKRNAGEVVEFLKGEIKNNYKSEDLRTLFGDELLEQISTEMSEIRRRRTMQDVDRGVVDLGTEIAPK